MNELNTSRKLTSPKFMKRKIIKFSLHKLLRLKISIFTSQSKIFYLPNSHCTKATGDYLWVILKDFYSHLKEENISFR